MWQVLLGALLYFIHDTIHNVFADRYLFEQSAIALAREGLSTSSVSTAAAEGTGSGCSPTDQPPSIHVDMSGTINAWEDLSVEAKVKQRSQDGEPSSEPFSEPSL